ncbi:MAG: low specificity L-threonine aldolase [Acidobacteria bacterium]|nr:low specificity L-threonine aldolase [Acidobacteriota bacterium]
MIDLRSDTVTKPTPAMREAMRNAKVGDDVYGEDPTVNRLERRAAEIFGKEAALFVPTGSMGNTLGVKLHTQHGQEILCEAKSHVMNYELAMAGWFAGCLCRTVAAGNGILTWDMVCKHIKPLSPHWAPTGLISLENTHNMAGGTVTPKAVLDEICDGAHALGVPVHLDGARVFNAATALGIPVRELTAKVDTVMFCLSKGLGAPVGSMLTGTRDAMDRARLYRKRLGGGMRQAGVLAAPGLIALEEMPARLGEDHANARLLADGVAAIPGLTIEPGRTQTNIVIFDTAGTGLTGAAFAAALGERGVLCNAVSERGVRFVTHYDVSRAACEAAIGACAEAAQAAPALR